MRIRTTDGAKVALEEALSEVDNPVGAARALARVARRFEPEAETSRDAFRRVAEQALAPFFDGDAKPVAWAVADVAVNVHESHESHESGGSDGRGSTSLTFVNAERRAPDADDLTWGDPIPLGPDPPEPYPVDALPDWLARHVRSVSEATQTPTDLPLMVSLAALSAASANKARLRVKDGYDVPAHLWTATVLPPASRKSPVFKHMTRPIFDHEEELADCAVPERRRAADEREVVEKALADVKREAAKAVGDEAEGEARQRMAELRERLEGLDVPAEPRLVASDVTTEELARLMADNGGRIAVLAPEGDLFRIMAGRYSAGVNFDHYKRGWTGDEPIRDDRVGRKGSHVRRPALTMGLCLQPSVLETLEAKEAFRGEGLLGRFLYAVPESGIGNRRTGTSVPGLDPDAARSYDRHLRRLLSAGPREVRNDGEYVPHELTLSPAARDAWDACAAEVESMLGPGGRLEHVPDWGGKLVGHALRAALIIHAAERVGDGASDPWGSELSGTAMRSAIRLARAAVPHALRVFDALEADPEVRLARYLVGRIRQLANREGELTKRDLHQHVKGKKGLGTAEDLDRVLEVLERHHLVRVVERESTGGRPPSPWVLPNPAAASKVHESHESPPREGDDPTSVTSVDAERGHGAPDRDEWEDGLATVMEGGD